MACVMTPIDVKQMVAVSNLLKKKYNVMYVSEAQIIAWIQEAVEKAVENDFRRTQEVK